jgi:hypothetical protein
MDTSDRIGVYLEIGQKRTFAGAIEWPGWCRWGRDEALALGSLLENGPRYGQVLNGAGLAFHPPEEVSAFSVIERLQGNATTDFGSPNIALASDARPVDDSQLHEFKRLFEACWLAFTAAIVRVEGRELRKGPRGGGRDLTGIIQHVLNAQIGDLSRLGWKFKKSEADEPHQVISNIQPAILEALASATRDELPARGPRGGIRWKPRFFVRQSTWHILDHVWEIEDRMM